MEYLENMEEPTQCIHCKNWFELSDGYESVKWHPEITICNNCNDAETKEMEIDEEVEDLKSDLEQAEYTVVHCRKRLKELGVTLPETKAEKWDNLDKKISEFYPEDENTEDDMEDEGLIGIGEVAARAFGYL